jgi:predicted CXXCH cytochrome family protein
MPSRKRLVAAALLLAGLCCWIGSTALRPRVERGYHRSLPSSAYRNTSTGVAYTGDRACATCHSEISASYRTHPMGRSLAPIVSAPDTGREFRADRPVFEAQGLEYTIDDRGGQVVHRESRRDSDGRLVASREARVQYVVGSGRFGFAYLVGRDGFLFQSPIAWYARAREWGLPPGYQVNHAHFDRPIQATCLFCHANHAESVSGTVNRYEPPVFRGHAIGCERCHGPGELHAAAPGAVAGSDSNIVNPGRLAPALRDAVCEQCHLNGRKRVLRAGRRDEDFRPGFAFHEFWTVLEPAESTAEDRFVGQCEQMRESRCSLASSGALGCISCHDPHRSPAELEKAGYYRDRCLKCHADRGCSLPVVARGAAGAADDCVRCHMPRLAGSNIVHVAETNHRIPRHGDRVETDPGSAGARTARPGVWVDFHRDLRDQADGSGVEREIAMVICHEGPARAAAALPTLDRAIAEHPDDVPALEAKGFALAQMDRPAQGLAIFERVLEIEPGREIALTGASYVAARAGRLDKAIDYCRRAIAISPFRADYRSELASLLFRDRDWPGAVLAANETLGLNPTDLETRKILVRALIRLGDSPRARSEFDTLLAFNPADRDEIERLLLPALERGSK